MCYDATTDHYVPIDWADAFPMIGRELSTLDSPNEAEFYTSGRTSNEAVFVYALRPSFRYEQFSGLLEHVPRSDQRRPA
jgi:hypothetical protein